MRSESYPMLSYLQWGECVAKTCEITRDLDKAYNLKIMLTLWGGGGKGEWGVYSFCMMARPAYNISSWIIFTEKYDVELSDTYLRLCRRSPLIDQASAQAGSSKLSVNANKCGKVCRKFGPRGIQTIQWSSVFNMIPLICIYFNKIHLWHLVLATFYSLNIK